MMIKQSPPSIRRLLAPIKPVKQSPLPDMGPGPISPLERNPRSPKGWKNRESDGVGLGIVAALERSDGRGGSENIALLVGSPRAQLGSNRRCCGNSHGPKRNGLFDVSPQKPMEDPRAFRPVNFLSFCYLCRKKLHGKDIYMYRGEKAFCSMECRCEQISSDEVQEKCGSEARRSSEVASSYTDDHRLFFMGVTAS